MQKLKILDLFSGLGGFSLGLERTGRYKTVAFCEIDKYCTLLLQKHWKGVKIYNDVKKITKEGFEADGIESPDIITGGFPCQPFSVAGKQKGTSDDRHLWPEMFRIIKAFKPRFVIGENVPGIVNIQDGVVFETVCTDLESQGYEVQPFNIPAAAVGAPHQRKRIWIIATLADSVSNDERREISRSDEEKGRVQEEHRSKDSASGIFSEQVKYGKATTDMKLWRTPDAHCNRGAASEKRMKMKLEKKMPISINDQVAHPNLMWPTPTQDSATDRKKNYSQGGKPLSLAVKERMWPTPRASAAMAEKSDSIQKRVERRGRLGSKLEESVATDRNWPTPTARDWKDSGKAVVNSTRHLLPQAVAKSDKDKWVKGGGSLNPTWVEWLMGYPAEYTDLKHWEILSSRKSQKK